MRRAACVVASLVFFCLSCLGEESQDKSRYNLFWPTPDALLRELATDRPDKTENRPRSTPATSNSSWIS